MDQLPLELIFKIFGNLDLSELMALRLVCKQFECIVKEVKIRELVLKRDFWRADYSSLKKKTLWLCTNKLQELDAFFSLSKYLLSGSFLSGGPFNVRFLKRLSIESLSDIEGIDLHDISRFQYLEHLEIGFDQPPPRDTPIWTPFNENPREVPLLFLPNLKALRIVSYYNQTGLEIEAPRLRALQLPEPLKVEDIGKHIPIARHDHVRIFLFPNFSDEFTNEIHSFKFNNPESIKFLSIPFTHGYSSYIGKFKKLEHLQIEHYSQTNIGLESIISKFRTLKRLSLCSGKLGSKFNLDEFIELAKWSEQSDLKVYYLGIELSNDPVLIDDFSFFHKASIGKGRLDEHSCELALQLKNYSLLSDRIEAISSSHLLYDELVDAVLPILVERNWALGGEAPSLTALLPVDFFEGYPKIVGIVANKKIKKEDHFIQLVKSCKNLRNLLLRNSQLSQAFFDELPAMSLLNFLKVEETSALNMNFLSKMNHLAMCATNQQLSPEIALKLARHGRLLACVIKNNMVAIRRRARDEYLLTVGSVKRVANFNSLIEKTVVRTEKPGPETITFEIWVKFLLKNFLTNQ